MKQIWLRLTLLLFGMASLNAAGATALPHPAEGEVLRNGMPYFQWQPFLTPTPAAMSAYAIEIANDSTFSRVVDKDRIAAVVSWYAVNQELAAGSYWWRVAGVNAAGERGAWSAAQAFSVQLPEKVFTISSTATFAEMQAVFAQAAANTPAQVRFAAGDYRLDPAGAAAFLAFSQVSDLIIDGNGANLVFTGFLKFVKLQRCRNVLVKNLSFDYDPLPYTAGRVLAIDGATGTFEVEVAPGHPLPESNPEFDRDRKGILVDPAYPRMKRGVNLVFEHAGWQKLEGRRYRFTPANKKQLSELAVGDIYVLDPRIATGFDVDASDDIVFAGLTAYAIANEGFNSHFSSYHRILNCAIRLKPGRFIAANNGGHNHHSARVGPWIEGCTWENTADDICHVNGLVMGISETLADDRLLLPLRNPYDAVGGDVGLDMQPADLLQFFNRDAGRLVSARRVVSATVSGGGLEVTLEGAVGDIVPGRPGSAHKSKAGVVVEGTITQVFNASRTCNQFVFRHNTVRNGRRVGVLAKGTGGVIEENLFTGLGGGAVEFWNAPFEGLGAVNYVVRNNRIQDCGQLKREHAAIWATIFKSGGDQLHRNLLIADNKITGFNGPAIKLSDVDGAVIRDNRIQAGAVTGPGGKGVEQIQLSNTSALQLQNNTIGNTPE